MKGLLVKDFALFLQRKKTFIFLAVWAVIMAFSMDDGSFMVAWMAIISSFFAISSLAYDEYDNCYPFLMSLPVDGRTYAIEKYVFGFICGFGAWLYSTVVYFVIAFCKGRVGDFGTELIQLAIFIPVFLLLMDFSLPLNMKFGNERGRMIILIVWAVVFGGVFVADKILDIDIPASSLQPGFWIIWIIFAVSAVLTVVSMIISIKVMEKKEY